MLVTPRQTLLVDRNYTFFDVKMEDIPKANNRTECIHVLDGELVKDRNEDFLKFFIFDALVVNGVNVMVWKFEDRLRLVKNKIIKKLRTREYFDIKKDRTDEVDDDEFKYLDEANSGEEPVKIFLKDFFLDRHTKFIHDNVIPKLDHGNDGIIYTMNACPYYPGTCQQIIKWKPAWMNSVDFNLKLITSYSDTEYIWGLYTKTFDTPELLFD